MTYGLVPPVAAESGPKDAMMRTRAASRISSASSVSALLQLSTSHLAQLARQMSYDGSAFGSYVDTVTESETISGSSLGVRMGCARYAEIAETRRSGRVGCRV